jgi:hypothetical protein
MKPLLSSVRRIHERGDRKVIANQVEEGYEEIASRWEARGPRVRGLVEYDVQTVQCHPLLSTRLERERDEYAYPASLLKNKTGSRVKQARLKISIISG